MTPSRYLQIVLGSVLLGLGAIAALNWYADPYGIYRYGRPGDPERFRAGIFNASYLHKAHALRELKPDAIVVSHARVLIGVDPRHPGLPPGTYNLGLGGAHLYEISRYLQEAFADHPPKLVVLGIDARMFTENADISPEFSEARMRVRADGTPTPFYRLADLQATLLSIPALYYSAKTLRGRTGAPQFVQGFPADFMEKVDRLDLTANVLKMNAKWLAPYLQREKPSRRLPHQMDAYAEIVKLCAAHGTRLVVFVHPLHARTIDQMTVDEAVYARWLRAVAALTAQLDPDAELWDFAGYNEISTEAFPPPSSENSTMHWYWEANHYRAALGSLVLDRLLLGKGPQGFGLRVTPANVDADLDRLFAERAAWHRDGRLAPLRW